ncbi:hypothetical protein GGQ72_004761 [Rhizobium rhizoryzae]|uniref:Uncharacterized protein n=1 Tax=Rhizobium rhizoryzae TaxID=451876 RepID=A0A7W6LKR2_9HYPH|nr:hypothetical protein [Rhizobium rhizoryzae]
MENPPIASPINRSRWSGLGRTATKRAMIRLPDGGDAVGGVAEALAWTPPYCVIDIHGTKVFW